MLSRVWLRFQWRSVSGVDLRRFHFYRKKGIIHMQPLKTFSKSSSMLFLTSSMSHHFCTNGTISQNCCQRYLKEKQAIWRRIRLSLNLQFILEKTVPKGRYIHPKVGCPDCRVKFSGSGGCCESKFLKEHDTRSLSKAGKATLFSSCSPFGSCCCLSLHLSTSCTLMQ